MSEPTDPAADALEKWAELQEALTVAQQRASLLEEALGRPGVPEGRLHPTSPLDRGGLADAAGASNWLLGVLLDEFRADLPYPLFGGDGDDDDDEG